MAEWISRSSAIFAHVETIAVGTGIRELKRLRRLYGVGRWRKMKGVVQDPAQKWPDSPRRITLV